DFTVPAEFEPNGTNGGTGRTVGMAIANGNSATTVVTMKVVDSLGNIVVTLPLTLQPFAQIALDFQQQPSVVAALPSTNFVGTITVTATNPVSAIALEDDLGPFSDRKSTRL